MKKVLSLLFLLAGVLVFGQAEPKMALGLGPELNMNSRENFAAGAAVQFDYRLPLPLSFAAGAVFTASSNFDGITVLEPAALFRWYFLGSRGAGFFAQADLGAFLVLEEGDVIGRFLGGLRGGLRLCFGQKFFVEPYGRIGYPFAFGIGALAGMRF